MNGQQSQSELVWVLMSSFSDQQPQVPLAYSVARVDQRDHETSKSYSKRGVSIGSRRAVYAREV